MIYRTRSDIVKAVEHQSSLNVGGSKSRLYNDSRTGKCAVRKNLDDDFASVISTALNQR